MSGGIVRAADSCLLTANRNAYLLRFFSIRVLAPPGVMAAPMTTDIASATVADLIDSLDALWIVFASIDSESKT